MDEKHFDAAEPLLRSYLAGDPSSAKAQYMLAYALLRQGKAKDSLAEYTRAAALRAPAAGDLRSVAEAYVLLEDYPDADRWMERALAMDRGNADTWYNLGRLRYTENRFQEAAACFERVLILAPKSVKAENNLGLAYEGLNRTADAEAAYRRAIAWQGEASSAPGSEQPLLNLAIITLHRGALQETETLLLRAVGIAPADPRIHEQLGQLYSRQSRFPEAERELRVASRLNPGKSNLHFLLGQALRHLGKIAEANVEFAEAARLSQVSAGSKPN